MAVDCIAEAILVGSDFSGLGSFELAATRVLPRFGRTAENVFSCETFKPAQEILLRYFKPERLFPDITTRVVKETPHVQWYAAGFPCQPFSMAGVGEGINDAARGLVVNHSLDYVEYARPELVLYENVRGLLQAKHRALLAHVLVRLQDAGYRCFYRLLNTADFGIPHQRERVYVVAIRQDRLRRPFNWPAPEPCPPLDVFLGGLLAAISLGCPAPIRVPVCLAHLTGQAATLGQDCRLRQTLALTGTWCRLMRRSGREVVIPTPSAMSWTVDAQIAFSLTRETCAHAWFDPAVLRSLTGFPPWAGISQSRTG